MKYSELGSEKKERLDDYLKRMADGQSSSGKEVLEQTTKSILLANTGGIAIASSILAANASVVNLLLLKIAGVVFVVGVLATIIFRFWLAFSIGKSIKDIKGFHMGLINGNEVASDNAIREKMNLFQKKLDGYGTVIPALVPIVLFFIGASLSCVSLFV